MEIIVQHFATELGKAAEKILSEVGLSDIDQLSLDLLKVSKEQICVLISKMIELLNEEFREDKMLRKELGLTLKEKNRVRTIDLPTGTLNFKRDYYMLKESKEYVYPVDSMVGITPYGRMSEHLCALLVNHVAELSYEKSTVIVTEGKVSKQTVKNKLMCVGKLEKEAPEERRIVKELQVLADEDHTHLQNGKNHQVPLITICEGIEEVCNGRNELVNAVHFEGDIRNIEATWEKVAGYIYQAYDEDELQRVNLHGDGAAWIKMGVEELPKCRHIMDEFHFEKYLKAATAPFPGKNYRYRIRQAIFSKDIKEALSIVLEMQRASIDNKQKKRVISFKTYLRNNWDSIVLRYTEKDVMGSCTEALISHVYSKRLSRNPMGWSEEGVQKMAELRVYKCNGCEVERKDFRRSKEEKNRSVLLEYSRKRFAQINEKPIDWSIFEKESHIASTNSPMQILIRSYGRLRSIA